MFHPLLTGFLELFKAFGTLKVLGFAWIRMEKPHLVGLAVHDSMIKGLGRSSEPV